MGAPLLSERFAIEDEGRTGGMGSVYRALDTTTRSLVALKVLRGKQDDHDAQRFAREADALAQLEHPAIVRYVSHGAEGDERFLAMEWLDGEDLAARLKRAPLTLRESVRLGRRVATALAHAHGRGVIHRDVKPANVFLVGGAVDEAKLIDFGIARLDAGEPVTRAGMIVGTPGYTAPEQARGDPGIDGRADIFGLGCVLYRCVAGVVAFPGETAVAVLAKIIFDEVPPISESVPDVPHALDELITRMLAKSPAARPRSAEDVAAQLEQIEARLDAMPPRATIRAMPPSLTGQERRLVSVILVAASPDDERTKATTIDTIVQGVEPATNPVRAVTTIFGARAERLADGTLVFTLAGTGSATDRAAHAARCALALRTHFDTAPMALATGHGLASGRVPLGDAIDRATEMLAATRALEGVPVDDVTAGLLDGRFEIRGDGASMLLLSERAGIDAKRQLLGKESPFVGREREIGTLLGLFDECVSEPAARAALVTANAGMGKSRLRYELLRRLRERVDADVQVWIARGDAMTRGSPYGLVAQLVRRAAGVLDGEPASLSARKIRARVGRRVPDERADRVAEFLGEISGVPFPDEGSVHLRAARRDPQLLGDQVRRAWDDFVLAESEESPLVVVIEDLHWGDLPSVRLIDGALARCHDRALFVLALARPEVKETFANLWAERGVLTMPLGELTKKASEKLVVAVLGDAIDQATTARLVAQAAGNALFLEELIRAASEGKQDKLPGSVLAMVQARIERLEDEARRVLRAASVFGESFWRGGLEALLGGMSTDAIAAWLDQLERREVVSCRAVSSIADESEYTFRHALVRDAAYMALTPGDRELGHRLAGGWLEKSGLGDASVLAGHFELGADATRAAELYVTAAEQAIGANDYVAAIARAQRGIALGPTGHTLGMLRLRQAEGHHWRGEYAESEEAARAALDLLSPGTAAWCGAVAELGVSYARRGKPEEARAAARLLLDTEPLPEGVATCIASAVRIAGGVVRLGLLDLTAELAELVERLAQPLASEPAVACRLAQLRAMQAYFAGDHEITARLLRDAVAAFERAGDLRNATGQRFNLSASHILLGAYEEGERHIRRALADAAAMEMRHSMLVGRFNLVSVLGRLGRLEEARTVGEQLVVDCGAREAAHFEGNARTYLSEVFMMMGAWDDAIREATRAVELLAATPAVAAYPNAILARTTLAKGDAAKAAEVSKAAVELSDKLGSGLEESDALARLTYAEALWHLGEHDAARKALDVAASRMRLRASRISHVAFRKSFLANVWENARIQELEKAWAEEAG